MVHSCNIYCYSMEAGQASLLNIKDKGKWMPFMFDMDIVEAIKLSSDEEDDFTYNCTTIYTTSDDHYVIDTPFVEFAPKFKMYRDLFDFDDNDDADDQSFRNNNSLDL